MLFKLLVFTFIFINTSSLVLYAQNSETHDSSVFSARLLKRIDDKFSSLQSSIEKKSLHTLQRLQKQENHLKRKMKAKDSVTAMQLFPIDDTYKKLAEQIKNPAVPQSLREYIPEFDSLKISLRFLSNPNVVTTKLPKDWANKLKNTSANLQSFENNLQQANNVQSFIKERKQLLKEQLAKYGMEKELKKFNKEVYYYQQQINEYKSLLKDRKKLETRAIAELRKLPAFTEFMRKNSQLAQLFRVPDNYGTPQALAGLQTRASIQAQIAQRFAGSGVNPQQYIGQQVQQAQGELNKLKEKLNKLGGGSNDVDMPDFKPNSQKTKSFLNRIEYGANVQSQKTNFFLPVTSDLALTAGYKLNDRSIIGIGASYKLGWGNGWKHIKLSHQGIGLRSFIDYKVKGSFWLSGGYECNYQHGFKNVEELKNLSIWQTSGLLGVTKKYKLRKKTNNLQLLWDFMSYRQVPRSQAILFRIGYTF